MISLTNKYKVRLGLIKIRFRESGMNMRAPVVVGYKRKKIYGLKTENFL